MLLIFKMKIKHYLFIHNLSNNSQFCIDIQDAWYDAAVVRVTSFTPMVSIFTLSEWFPFPYIVHYETLTM